MDDLLFYDVTVDREVPLGQTLDRLRESGFAVTGDYGEKLSFLNDGSGAAGAVELALARLPEGIRSQEEFGRFARQSGLRLATLRETAALAAARPEVFAGAENLPVAVVGDPLRIEGDPDLWIPVFPSGHGPALGVAPAGDFWGDARFPVAKL